MKNRIFTLIILSLLCGTLLQAQDTRGTEFWLAFGKNSDQLCHRNSMCYPSGMTVQIRIVTGDQAATGSINFTGVTGEEATVNFTISANQVYTYTLTDEQKKASCNVHRNIQETEKSKQSIFISTDNPVSVYGYNQIEQSAAASHVLPVTALGTEYYNISYQPVPSGGPGFDPFMHAADAYAIIATQNNTEVNYSNRTETINRGEVLYVIGWSDLTGRRITSNRPIALFSMNQMSRIPSGTRWADHLFEQIAPTHTWGKTFFVPVSHMGRDIVRIVGLKPGTTITQTGGTVRDNSTGSLTNLGPGQFVELEISLANRGCFIVANQPVGVCTYLTGSEYNGSGISDPEIAWMPPIEQSLKSVLVAPFISPGSLIGDHFALIVTPTATKANTTLKMGNEEERPFGPDDGIWYDNPSANMSFFWFFFQNSNDAYLFRNDAGIIVLGYGVSSNESYYYLAGSAMRTLDVAFYVDDIHFEEITAKDVFCSKQHIQFRAEIEEILSVQPGHIRWYVNGSEIIEARDKVTWERSFPSGNHIIRLDARLANFSIRSVTTTIKIEEPILAQLENPVFCAEDTTKVISFTGTDVANVTWTAPGGTRIGLPAESGTGDIPSFIAKNIGDIPDTVLVTVIPFSSGNCEGEPKTFMITVSALPVLEPIPNINLCVGDSTPNISFKGSNILNVNWIALDGSAIGMDAETGTGDISSFTTTNTTVYSLTATILATPHPFGGCSGTTRTFSITVHPLPILHPIKDIFLCTDETITEISFSGTNVDSVFWEAPDGITIGMNLSNGTGNISGFTATNTNDEPLSVTVTAMPKSSAGCEGDTLTFIITVYSKEGVKIDLGNDTTICWIDSLLLNDHGQHPAITSYEWQDRSTGATYTVYQETAKDYWLIVKGVCGIDSDTINISYLSDPVINLGNDTVYCKTGDNLPLDTLDVTNQYASYLWQDGSESPVYIVREGGTYSVTVSNACISISREITIEEMDCSLDFNIPNVFTPNGDGLNDIFGPELIPPENMKEFQMFIYNRWGRLVFSTEDYQNLWDGNNKNGKPYPEGVYYAVIYFTDIMGKEYKHHTSITLIR